MDKLQIPALRVRQGEHSIYSFAVDGKLVDRIAGVSRLHRDGECEVMGYQRTEMPGHIGEIRRYLESATPMIPNAVVIAFDERVRFVPQGMGGTPYAEPGELSIPLDDGQALPGWIVDGQQRIAAIREARIDAFPICVTGFITSDVSLHREQFILVNATKPLPRGLLYELLPVNCGRLPGNLERRRFPACLMERLGSDPISPFHRLIQTRTTPEGIVNPTSILRMLEYSLEDGVLFQYWDRRATGRGDVEAMVATVMNFWEGVRRVFPKCWGLPPSRSRLLHGAGVIAMGLVMDAIADRHEPPVTRQMFEDDIRLLEGVCAWTEGYWKFRDGTRKKWNAIQATRKDIALLADLLLAEYMAKAGRGRLRRRA